MLFLSFFFVVCVVLLGLFKFFLNYDHFIVSLFSIEFMMLALFTGVLVNLQFFFLDYVFMLYFLILMVCEAILGLCFLVLMSFYYGSDYLMSFNVLEC